MAAARVRPPRQQQQQPAQAEVGLSEVGQRLTPNFVRNIFTDQRYKIPSLADMLFEVYALKACSEGGKDDKMLLNTLTAVRSGVATRLMSSVEAQRLPPGSFERFQKFASDILADASRKIVNSEPGFYDWKEFNSRAPGAVWKDKCPARGANTLKIAEQVVQMYFYYVASVAEEGQAGPGVLPKRQEKLRKDLVELSKIVLRKTAARDSSVYLPLVFSPSL